MAVVESVVSPELVLVSPPELATRARAALPDYDQEYADWIVHVRDIFAEARVESARRHRVGALIFTTLGALNAAVSLLVLIVFR
jgi:hypothetical protein